MTVQWAPLAKILTPRPRETVDTGGSYPIAGVYGFSRGVLLRDAIAGSETKYKTLTRLHTGDVVFSKLKAFEGAVAVATAAADGYYVSPEFPVFQLVEDVSPRYLAHMIGAPQFLDGLAALSSGLGARRERVRPEKFLSLRVPLPTRTEQDRIAAHLDVLERDAGSEARTTSARTTGLVNNLIRSAGRGAERVRVSCLLERARQWIEIDPDAMYEPIGVRGFGRGMIRYQPTAGRGLSKLRYYRLAPGNLLISNIKAWEGAVCIVAGADGERVASNRFLQYRAVDDPSLADWLHRYLLTPDGVAQLANASPGSADRNRTLSMESFEAIEVPVPSQDVRMAVARIAARADTASDVDDRRTLLRAAVLPAARNEIFVSMV